MGMVDFSRGELSPDMRYRSDLADYHKGVATFENSIPDSSSGYSKRKGSQVLRILPTSVAAPAVRMFTLGATGLASDITAPGTGATVTIGSATYDTDEKVNDIPKHEEIQILLTFTEDGSADEIAAYWVDTPTGVPAYLQKIWNYDSGNYSVPSIDFDDTRDVRVVQIETEVYIIAKTQIYRIYWDKSKPYESGLDWVTSHSYSIGDVVHHVYDSVGYFFECIEAHTSSSTNSPSGTSGNVYWIPIYYPYISWEIVSPRVGYELLSGAGITGDEFAWNYNKEYAINTGYYKGDVVLVSSSYYECQQSCTTGGTITDPITDFSADYWTNLGAIGSISDEDKIYKRSSYAYREETVPREVVSHHNRLIFAGSSARPTTIHGSKVSHFLDFGAGTNNDEPWIVKLSGDRVGKILWLAVTDQLYIGTSGGVFGVSDVITPNQFILRKVTSHTASDIAGVAVAGSLIFFQKNRKTIREVEYVGQAQNYHALDLTVHRGHLFDEFSAVKMVVTNTPEIVIWILRSDGTLVSLSYEKTVGMYAFSRHELHGIIFDICPGTDDSVFAIIETPAGIRQVIKIGDVSLVDSNDDVDEPQYPLSDFRLDGLISFVNIDNSNQFATEVLNDSFRAWMEGEGITSLSAMLNLTTAVDASSSSLSGTLLSCELQYFDEVPSINLSGNSLTGEVPENLVNTMSSYVGVVSFDISGNSGIDIWNLSSIPATWGTINLANTGLSLGQVKKVLEYLRDSVEASSRTGTINLTGLGAIDYNHGLADAQWLKNTAGWTVTIDNAAGWEGSVVSYDGNGSTSGSMTADDCLYGQTISLSQNLFLRTNYEFSGWATSPTGSAVYADGSSFTKQTDENITLYAVWTPNNMVVYNGNNNTTGTVPVDSNTYNPGETVTVKANTGSLVKNGHTFTGWNTQPDGLGQHYVASGTATFEMGSTAVTLYAEWDINDYTVTYNGNGKDLGTVPSSQTVEYGSSATVSSGSGLMNQKTSGEWRKFNKWNTAADGSGVDYVSGASITVMGNVTLYARWTAFDLGDDGPGGGLISFDAGSFGTHYGLDNWRYAETRPDHQSSGAYAPDTMGRFTIGGKSWGNLHKDILSYIMTNKATIGLGTLSYSTYWSSSQKGNFYIFFWVYVGYYSDTSGSLDTSSKDDTRGLLPGRYI